MEALSVREYRNNLAASFTKADNGEQVLIRRKNEIYALVKVGREDLMITPELQAKVTARYQIDSHVYEYLRYSCGFTSEEINRNKETFITAQEKITDLIGELALLNGTRRTPVLLHTEQGCEVRRRNHPCRPKR
jgi:hypothetical protein